MPIPQHGAFQADSNVGFGGGVNKAVRLLEPAADDAVWVLNPDTIVEPGATATLAGVLRSRAADIVSPCILQLLHDRASWRRCLDVLTWYLAAVAVLAFFSQVGGHQLLGHADEAANMLLLRRRSRGDRKSAHPDRDRRARHIRILRPSCVLRGGRLST
jgi:hypothetical protein